MIIAWLFLRAGEFECTCWQELRNVDEWIILYYFGLFRCCMFCFMLCFVFAHSLYCCHKIRGTAIYQIDIWNWCMLLITLLLSEQRTILCLLYSSYQRWWVSFYDRDIHTRRRYVNIQRSQTNLRKRDFYANRRNAIISRRCWRKSGNDSRGMPKNGHE